jgi:ABC-type cobalamin/Fe3+-siderophores transport system ATPase subunit
MSVQPVLPRTAEPAADRPRTEAKAQRLGILETLFRRLDEEQIRYCHWKSNEHLDASLTGATDVDALFARAGAQRLAHLLTSSTDFKRLVVKAGRGYPGIEDYVGFDHATGKLTHLHVHYQLTLGEKFLKGHRLPWEGVMLDTRVRDADSRVWVTEPHLETLILISRHAMKLRWRDGFLALLGHEYFRGSMLRELRWLAERVRSDQLVQGAEPLVGPVAAALLPGMIGGRGPSIRQLRAFRRHAAPPLTRYRMYSAAGASRRMWLREMTWIWWRVKHWVFGAPTRSTRTPPQGGLLIAFVGPDGAGKSTLTQEVARWLAREVAVILTYGGSGKGSASPARRLLQRFAALTRRGPAGGAAPKTEPTAPGPERGGVRLIGRLLWVLALARERRRWGTVVRRARSLGMVVLSDRLPQTQFAGLNDGPRYGHWMESPSWLRRLIARREHAAFREAALVPPDVVVRLNVPMDVAASRKPETPTDQLRRKVEVVAQLQFPAGTRVIEVDAAQPLERVLLDVKQAVWEAL